MITDTKFLEIYHRQQESGLSVKEFCTNEVMKESTFYYWRKKLVENGRIKGFIPIVVKTPSAIKPNNHALVLDDVDKSSSKDVCLLELVYANGTKLRIKNDIGLDRLRNLINLCD